MEEVLTEIVKGFNVAPNVITYAIAVSFVAFVIYVIGYQRRSITELWYGKDSVDKARVEDKIDSICKTLQAVQVEQWKLVIVEEKFPIVERLEAYQKYHDAGGNGAITEYYEQHLQHYERETADG